MGDTDGMVIDYSSIDPVAEEDYMLHAAVAAGDTRKVAEILKQNNTPPLELRDELDQTPLFLAAFYGLKDIAVMLIDRGADLEARNASKKTPLLIASFYGHASVVEALVKKGADINAQSGEAGYSPLILSVMRGDAKLVRLFIQLGADLDIKTFNNSTALELAERRKFPEIVTILKDEYTRRQQEAEEKAMAELQQKTAERQLEKLRQKPSISPIARKKM